MLIYFQDMTNLTRSFFPNELLVLLEYQSYYNKSQTQTMRKKM